MLSIAIVPAAGKSARFGRQKLLLPWGESNIIRSVLGAWRESRVDHIFVVAPADDLALVRACAGEKTMVIPTSANPPDMKASICIGLEAARIVLSPCDADVWLTAPADIPSLSAEAINQVLATAQAGSARLILPSIGGERAHPLLLPWKWNKDVFALQANEGLNQLTKRLLTERITITAPAQYDIDTLEDYSRLHQDGKQSS